ncbi:hypothetical protein [Maribacter sp. 2210JD10-5]|uniref:hypothetical protein n=1 Tax=Maribacter sp. 2210JD10-5 TaxID=3386272 RepID=UPI0039BD7AAE
MLGEKGKNIIHKKNVRLGIVALSLFLLGCTEKHLFDFVPYAPPSGVRPKLEKIDFFLETSVSMKGYVNVNKPGYYPLKDVVSYLITDMDNKYDDVTTIYTVSDSPRKYLQTKEHFNDQLRKGNLLNGRSSKLQNIFGPIIDSLQSNSISILVSDCILDLGDDEAMTEGSSVTSKIYDHLIKKPDAAVALFKYLSDFNGTYYYDRKNTGSYSHSARPYYNTILKNRPFYIWVLGDKQLVEELLSQNLFEDSDKVYAYNISMDDVPFAILKEPRKGKVAINPIQNMVLMKDVEQKRPVQFTIGVNLEKHPSFYENLLMNVENYEILPSHLTNTTALETKTKNELKGSLGNGFTHFLQPTLSDMDVATTEITFSLKNPPSTWFKETHLTDDYQVPAETLEHKTFAFHFITDAFDKAYRDTPALLEFKLLRKQHN